MSLRIRFNEEKNQLLRVTRKVSFEDVLVALKNNCLLADISHPSAKHLKQRVYVVMIADYAYVVPYILNIEKQEIFLKTIYPSRIFTKKYLHKGKI